MNLSRVFLVTVVLARIAEGAKAGPLETYDFVNCLAKEVGSMVAAPTKTLDVPVVTWDANQPWKMDGEFTFGEVIGPGKANLERQLKIIDYASGRMTGHGAKGRGWSGPFMKSRRTIQEIVQDRSIVVPIYKLPPEARFRPPSPEQLDEYISASMGITWSKMTKAEWEALGKDGLLNDSGKVLGMEHSFGVPVTRHFDKDGRGIAVELRAYAKEEGSPLIVTEDQRTRLISMTMQVIKDYPELYDLPIIYTYGDRASRKLYGPMFGFKVQEHITPLDKPFIYPEDLKWAKENGVPEQELTKWWYMAVTPREFEKNLLKYKGPRTVSGSNLAHEITLPNGKLAKTQPGSIYHIGGKNRVEMFTAAEEVEVHPGLYASPGSEVRFHREYGGPVSITKIARPYRMGEKQGTFNGVKPDVIDIPAGASFRYGDYLGNGLHRPTAIELNGRTTAVREGSRWKVNGAIYTGDSPTRVIRANGLVDDYELAPGLWAAKGTDIRFYSVATKQRGNEMGIVLGKPFQLKDRVLPPGTRVIVEWNAGVPSVYVDQTPAHWGIELF